MTALGRLLRSGALRDSFAADPVATITGLGVVAGDAEALAAMSPVDLEAQATVLLRKRFEVVRRATGRTCMALGQTAWDEFRRYGRMQWPVGVGGDADDAANFLAHLRAQTSHAEAVCPLEWRRFEFARSKARLRVRFVWARGPRRARRPGLAIWWRRRSRCDEWLLYLGA